MPRHVDLFDDRLRILFSGLDSLAVFRSELSIPYSTIERVEAGLDDVPSVWTWRLGISLPFSDRRQGWFWADGKKLFFDIRSRTRAVVLHLKPGGEFSVVAFDDSRPDELAADIRRKIS
jgi:hypothetical protein